MPQQHLPRRCLHPRAFVRGYGAIQNPAACPVDSEIDDGGLKKGADTRIQTYEKQIQELKSQLEKSEAREQAAQAEKMKLLKLADSLVKQNETLMLPPPRKPGFLESIKKVFTPT